MRLAIATALVVLAGALVAASTSEAQQAPLDLGEPTALGVACSALIDVGEAQGLGVRNCRRYEPDEITGNKAVLHVRIATDQGNFIVDVEMLKSLWQTTAYASR